LESDKMSLMSTLAKVAIGVAVAKGAGAMMNKSGGVTQASSGGGLGGLLDSLAGASGLSGGGMQDMLGGLLGGNTGGGVGGLGGFLESLGGAQAGGLQGMLDGLVASGGAGGLMGAFTGAMGGNAATAPAQNNSSFGAVLNSAFDANPEPAIAPTADQEAIAALMLRTMIQAA
jgi:hypothetical protein